MPQIKPSHSNVVPIRQDATVEKSSSNDLRSQSSSNATPDVALPYVRQVTGVGLLGFGIWKTATVMMAGYHLGGVALAALTFGAGTLALRVRFKGASPLGSVELDGSSQK